MERKEQYFKYQGAGNDFLVADNRDGLLRLDRDRIVSLCDRRYGFGGDGLMLLEQSDRADFRMVFYNPDGSGGMMCGNGGRCMVAFAARCGFRRFDFEAADGLHTARILSADADFSRTTVQLKMGDVTQVRRCPDGGWFLNTGTRHYVRLFDAVPDVARGMAPDAVSGASAGTVSREAWLGWNLGSFARPVRYADEFAPEGTNVNAVLPREDGLWVRTFEKGVEDETYACGTGIVASCIAAWAEGRFPADPDGVVRVPVLAVRDRLAVEFRPVDGTAAAVSEVWLTGPATFVGEVIPGF